MRVSVKNMTAVVTGGSSGIGLEYARQLLAMGCRVVIVSNREQELADAAVELRTASSEVQTLFLDLTGSGSGGRLLEWCDRQGLEVDILVNNAGIFFMEYLNEACLGKARKMMDLHIKAVTELCILFGSRMKERGRGYILNMSSMTARIPSPGIAIYSASKAYIKSFSKGFGYEMRPFGVVVTTVSPAAVDTGLYKLNDGMRKHGCRLGLIQTPETLVRRALRAMFRGRRSVSPGIMNVLLPPLIAILPARLIDRLGLKWMPH